MFLFHLQELDLLAKRLAPVKIGTADDLFDIFQRKLQFPEEQDLLQFFQTFAVIQAIACCRNFRRMQKSYPVIILQGAYTHPCHPAYFADSHHSSVPSLLSVKLL